MKFKKPLAVLATSFVLSSGITALDGVIGEPLVASAQTTPHTVTASVLNIRSGAGTNHSIIGTLRNGQTIQVQSISGGWARFTHNGRTAFVSTQFIRAANTPAPPPATTGTTAHRVTASALNIRSGAGANHGIIGTLRNGQTIQVQSISGGWARFTHNGRTAFVSTQFIQRVDNAPAPTPPPATGTTPYRVTASTLNIRSGAGTNHGIIGTLRNGQTIQVQSISGGWARFTHNGRTAFVSAQFIQRVNNAPAPAPTPPPTVTRTPHRVTASALNVRSGAGTNHGVIAVLRRDEIIQVESISGGWARFTHNGRTAFVSADFIQRVNNAPAPTPPPAPAPTPEPAPQPPAPTPDNTVSAEVTNIQVPNTGITVAVPRSRTIVAYSAFDFMQGIRAEVGGTNLPITRGDWDFHWSFTHNGVNYGLRFTGVMDHTIPGTYQRTLELFNVDTGQVIGTAPQTITVIPE